MDKVSLLRLNKDDTEGFIRDNQRAFNYGALEEFGLRDNHFEEDGEIISRATIESSIRKGAAYRIISDEKIVGGAVVSVKGDIGELELFFTNPKEHSKGVGTRAWFEIEKMYPQVKKWETFTPYFETRNIHFYVNKCGFQIVEFFNKFHKIPDKYRIDESGNSWDTDEFDGIFRFEKIIKGK